MLWWMTILLLFFSKFDMFPKAVAWAGPGRSPATNEGLGSAQQLVEPEPPQAGPEPRLLGRAGLAHHYGGDIIQQSERDERARPVHAWPKGILIESRRVSVVHYVHCASPLFIFQMTFFSEKKREGGRRCGGDRERRRQRRMRDVSTEWWSCRIGGRLR